MKLLNLFMVGLAIVIITVLAVTPIGNSNRKSSVTSGPNQSSEPNQAASNLDLSRASGAATQRYRLDDSQSKFIAHADAGGLLWFKGHDHLIAVRDFSGEAQLAPDSITAASLEFTAKTESMVETSSVFTEPQKQIINKELREIVLEPSKYPDIVFRSTSVTGKATSANHYDLNITGNLTLHGVTRQIKIPTTVLLTGRELRGTGEFSIDRSDFNVKATSAFHGLVRVRDKVKFTFDIVGHQI